ncbi:MAG: hypothetical protein AAGA64_16600 [Bacteroidota bacterium]
MSVINLTQEEADYLCKMEKTSVDNKEWELPDLGGKVSIPLISVDRKENFYLDISRGKIDLKRQKYQSRAREAIVLVRLDLGSPHRNPDGEEIGVPHIHYYREGYGTKWAYALPQGVFKNIDDAWQILTDFMEYCNIVHTPNFRKGLFT